jgi:hypothetical protein
MSPVLKKWLVAGVIVAVVVGIYLYGWLVVGPTNGSTVCDGQVVSSSVQCPGNPRNAGGS